MAKAATDVVTEMVKIRIQVPLHFKAFIFIVAKPQFPCKVLMEKSVGPIVPMSLATWLGHPTLAVFGTMLVD